MSDIRAEPADATVALKDTGATILTLGGLAAAFGVASCCGLPFLLATLGIGSAWLSGIASMAAPHRALLLTAAAVCLVGGAVLVWRRRTAVVCTPGAISSRPAVRGLTIVGLVVGAILLTIGYMYA